MEGYNRHAKAKQNEFCSSDHSFPALVNGGQNKFSFLNVLTFVEQFQL